MEMWIYFWVIGGPFVLVFGESVFHPAKTMFERFLQIVALLSSVTALIGALKLSPSLIYALRLVTGVLSNGDVLERFYAFSVIVMFFVHSFLSGRVIVQMVRKFPHPAY